MISSILSKLLRLFYTPKAPCVAAGENAVLIFPDKAIPCYKFLFLSERLCSAVLMKHQQGIRIRIITDVQYMNLSGSQIFKLIESGVEVRYNKQNSLMHHKFAIIDKQKIMTGSFNWTQAAIESNHENLLILNDKTVISQYAAEFEKLWNNFEPPKFTSV